MVHKVIRHYSTNGNTFGLTCWDCDNSVGNGLAEIRLSSFFHLRKDHGRNLLRSLYIKTSARDIEYQLRYLQTVGDPLYGKPEWLVYRSF